MLEHFGTPIDRYGLKLFGTPTAAKWRLYDIMKIYAHTMHTMHSRRSGDRNRSLFFIVNLKEVSNQYYRASLELLRRLIFLQD